ncbi:hypothetical protein FSI92_017725 [Escherichia coli]|nr:hypothetical protein [Escherichia coli]
MTYIRRLLFICCSVLFSGSVYAECFDTPATLKTQDTAFIGCISQEKNLALEIYTSIGGAIYVSFRHIPLTACNIHQKITNSPSKIINGKAVRFAGLCDEVPTTKSTYSYDVPVTSAGLSYIKQQLLRNKPLIVTSPNKDNPFKATFDTHKYRGMILNAFNANDGIHGGI